MSTYNGFTVLTMPTTPAPSAIEFRRNDIVGINESPFTGQQQVYDWGAGWYEATLTFPPMSETNAQAWIAFVSSLTRACCFQFTYLVPTGSGSPACSGYWRMKDSTRKWSVGLAHLYGFALDVREVK